jgi:hypothetical protein
MRLKKTGLVAAAAVTGTVCALGAAGAASAGTVWSKTAPRIPGSYTNASPGLASFEQNNVFGGTFVVWKGQLSNDVYYRYKVDGKWSAVRAVPNAHTNSSPAAAFYTNAQSQPSELIAWKALHSTTIWYTTALIGSTPGGALTGWTSPRSIAVKGDKLAYSDTGPSILFPINSPGARVIITWRGPGHHVRYELGSESGKNDRLFTFDASNWISGGTTTKSTTTSGTPSLAEQVGANGNGTVYVFWKADGNGKGISYARIPDNKGGLDVNSKGQVTWKLLGGVPGADSTSAPVASNLDPVQATGQVMLAYKGPGGDFIRYQLLTLSSTGTTSWSSVAFVSGPDNTTAIGPGLLGNTLVNVSPTSSGDMYVHTYTG